MGDFDSSGTLDTAEMRHLILEITPTSKRKRRRHGGGRSALTREAMFRMLLGAGGKRIALQSVEKRRSERIWAAWSVEDQSFLTRRLSMGISQKNKKKKKNVGHAGDKNYCDPDDHGTDVTITRESFLKATVIVSNDESTLAGSFPCDHAIHYLHRYKLVSLWLSGGAQVLLLFHAPVSAKAFLFFDCHRLGERFFLRADYRLECFTAEWDAFLPLALFLLLGFAVAVPLGLGVIMFRNRDHLQSPATRQRIGFLMSRYSVGVEWWEIVELVRKLILTGVLIYFPTTSRAAAAVIVCVVCVAMLNLYEPHKTRAIFWVCQGSYLITTTKYLVTTFEASNSAQSETLGGILIFTDVAMYVAGAFCILLLFRTWVIKRPGEKSTGALKIGNKGASDAAERSSTSFVKGKGQLSGQNPVSNISFKNKFRKQVDLLRRTMEVYKVEAASETTLKRHNTEVIKRKMLAKDRLKLRLTRRKSRAQLSNRVGAVVTGEIMNKKPVQAN